jgi:hypothetical protein
MLVYVNEGRRKPAAISLDEEAEKMDESKKGGRKISKMNWNTIKSFPKTV